MRKHNTFIYPIYMKACFLFIYFLFHRPHEKPAHISAIVKMHLALNCIWFLWEWTKTKKRWQEISCGHRCIITNCWLENDQKHDKYCFLVSFTMHFPSVPRNNGLYNLRCPNGRRSLARKLICPKRSGDVGNRRSSISANTSKIK